MKIDGFDLVIPERDIKAAIDAVRVLQLSEQQKKWAMRSVGRRIIRDARKNIRRQQEVSGKSFKRRKDGSNKKLLIKMARYLSPVFDAYGVTVGYRNNLTGEIAKRQQEGIPETYTAQKMKEISGTDYEDKVTRKQAKRLIQAGYRMKNKSGRGYKRPSIKWLTENMTQGRFGHIYSALTNKKSKSSWRITPAPRPFLGETEIDLDKIMEEELLKVQKSNR